MWYSVTTMPKFLGVCLCYLRLYVSFQHSTDFLRSPSNEYSDTNFLDFLSRCIHKVLIKMPWSKLDWNFIDLFRLWVSNSWPRHLVLLMHLLRKSRKPLQAVSHLDGLLMKICWMLKRRYYAQLIWSYRQTLICWHDKFACNSISSLWNRNSTHIRSLSSVRSGTGASKRRRVRMWVEGCA